MNLLKSRYSIILIVTFLIFLNIVYYFYTLIYQPYDEKLVHKTVIIESGTSTYLIGLILEDEGLIHSAFLFLIYTKYISFSNRLLAGRYELNTHMSMVDIIKILQKGSYGNAIYVTIPEGFNITQIAIILEEKTIVGKEKFLTTVENPEYLQRMSITRKNLEGYLFPDTYHFTYQLEPKRVVVMMLDRFEELALPQFKNYQNRNKYNLDQIIILASIIEKEAAMQDEMPKISSVFHNRLRLGIPLQAEPTIRYAVGNSTTLLSQEEIQSDSPYNTYRYKGLPYGPICNPGLAAIDAALNPDKTGYLYFVSRNDNTHEFNYTLSQHNDAVAKYKRILLNQKSNEFKGSVSDSTK